MKATRLMIIVCSVTLAMLAAGLFLSHGIQATSTTWYVAPNGDDANDCATVSTPCATINRALSKSGFAQGATILVAGGIYTGTGNAVVQITTSVQLLGGWSSDFTAQSDLSTIDGEGTRRGLEITNSTVTLDHFIVQHGYAVTSDDGGALLMNGSIVTITESVIRQNVSGNAGAGVYQVGGVLNVHNSAFLENIGGNNITGDGGALYQNGGVANFNNTTVSKNQAGFGGGAFGLYNYAVLNLNSTTVVSNITPGYGGAITIDYLQGTVNLQNTILAGNQGGPTTPECTGPVHSLGYNLVGNTGGCDFTSAIGDRLNMDPQLSVLTGTIPYYDLSYTNPAVNKGNPDGCRDTLGNLLPYDQRGLSRVGHCDIGAIEFQQEIHTVYLPAILRNYCSDFFDDFSDPLSGWPVENNADVESRYLNGEYSIYSKNGDYIYLFNSPSCLRDNYAVETDVRWAGSTGDGYGIVFGITDSFSQYYLFYVSADYGDFALIRRDSS